MINTRRITIRFSSKPFFTHFLSGRHLPFPLTFLHCRFRRITTACSSPHSPLALKLKKEPRFQKLQTKPSQKCRNSKSQRPKKRLRRIRTRPSGNTAYKKGKADYCLKSPVQRTVDIVENATRFLTSIIVASVSRSASLHVKQSPNFFIHLRVSKTRLAHT